MPTPKQGYVNSKGEPLPGCTTILGVLSSGSNDALLSWSAKLAREGLDWRKERERSAKLGTWIHDVLEHYPDPLPNREPWMTDDEWSKAVRDYSDYAGWFAAIGPKIIAQEVQLVSEIHSAGGTPDQISDIGGNLTVVDHKTGKTVDIAKIAAQLAFYAFAALENGVVQKPIKKGLILHYGPKGLKPIEITEDQMRHGLQLFAAARSAYALFKSFPRA